MTPNSESPDRGGRDRDFRWLSLLIVAAWWLAVFGASAGPARVERMKSLGVFALSSSFSDLRIFPFAQSVVARGGDPYSSDARDPMGRPYNYPRIWLTFMRFSDRDAAVNTVGVSLAVVSLAVLLAFWGPCTSPTRAAALGGLLCLPAVQLGVERGNTDQLMVALVAAACLMAARKAVAGYILLGAAVLKLYPCMAFGALAGQPTRGRMRAIGWPLLLFLLYLAATATDTKAALRNTPDTMWIFSYGACVVPSAWAAISARNGWGSPDPEILRMGARLLAALLVALGVLLGLGGGSRREPDRADATRQAPDRFRIPWERSGLTGESPHGLGFSAATWIFAGTFVAGSNFDYRLVFLLLAVPQLLVWAGSPVRQVSLLAILALAALVLSLGSNFLWGGGGGLWVKQAASWTLVLVLPWLLAAVPSQVEDSGSTAS